MVAFLAQQMAKAPITRLMRIAWDTVGAIVERVIAERLDRRRLDSLRLLGIDESVLPAPADRRRRTPNRPDRVGGKGPQQRDLAGVIRWLRATAQQAQP